MKVYDCFIFFNELDLLELRFNVMTECVDYFVIVESGVTFQGEKKEYIFENNKSRFAKFANKIIYFKVENYPLDFSNLPYILPPTCVDDEILNSIYRFIDNCPHFDKKKEFWWGNEFFQRECIWRALALAKPRSDDLILISDLDEVPNPETIAEIESYITSASLFCLRQHEFCYYLNYYHNSAWLGTCCFLFGEFSDVSLNSIRVSGKRNEGLSPEILNNGGWHFTSIGGVDAIKTKITSWGHRELNTRSVISGVEYNVRHGYDIFRRSGFGRLTHFPFDHEMLPIVLNESKDKFQHLIGPEIDNENLFQRLFFAFYFKARSIIDRIF